MSPAEFLHALMIYCSITRGSVLSFGRTPKHNLDLGGVEGSPHLFWVGADVVYDVKPSPVLAPILAERLGLKLVREDDHDHLQPSDWRAG